MESQKDFDDIMSEVKKVKFQIPETKKPTITCAKCKFNAFSIESLNIHIENVHEQFVYKCQQCTLCFLSEDYLKTHNKLTHHTEEPVLLIKKSLTLIKG